MPYSYVCDNDIDNNKYSIVIFLQARERTQTKSLGEVDLIKEIMGSEKLSTSKKIDERTGIVYCRLKYKKMSKTRNYLLLPVKSKLHNACMNTLSIDSSSIPYT